MIKGLYIAGTSMTTNIHKMDVISNNLANINTTGYKKDSIEVESFNSRLFSRVNGSNIPFETGTNKITKTQNGQETSVETQLGYFKIETPNGVHYSKSMNFFKDDDGYLRTIYKNIGGSINNFKGNLILGDNGPIYVGDQDFTVDDYGNISAGGTKLDALVSNTASNVIGTMSAGIRGNTVLTNYEQGQLEMTSRNFDVAIKGDGFFNIRTDQGDFYSRNGSFTINALNELVTIDGGKVLGINGPITLASDSFTINNFGEVIQNGEIIDKLMLTNFSNVSDIYKIGGSYFKEKANISGEKIPFDGEIFQGFLEQSNADSITEMIQLIEMNRSYESSQKVITTIDDMIGKAVTELGRV